MARTEIRLGGLGGQGIIKSAVIIGEAASIHDGKEAVQTASYGPESRGSACKAEVIISDTPVDYPLVLTPHVMVALSNDAFHKYKDDLSEGAITIIDSDLVKAGKIKPGVQVYQVAAATTAHKVLKNPLVTNVVMLGAFTAITKAVTPKAMRKAIANAFPRYKELNLRAFDEGMKLGKEAMEQSSKPK
ncbi:MAG: 2-oxoacid:acceptor oxidoreductase family protein [Candidatus Odinarchaeota archaeon]